MLREVQADQRLFSSEKLGNGFGARKRLVPIPGLESDLQHHGQCLKLRPAGGSGPDRRVGMLTVCGPPLAPRDDFKNPLSPANHLGTPSSYRWGPKVLCGQNL